MSRSIPSWVLLLIGGVMVVLGVLLEGQLDDPVLEIAFKHFFRTGGAILLLIGVGKAIFDATRSPPRT
jgi:hypothetical protein